MAENRRNRRNRRYSHPVGKPFSIRLPADLEQELERRVAEKPCTKRNAVITAAVREWLAEGGKNETDARRKKELFGR